MIVIQTGHFGVSPVRLVAGYLTYLSAERTASGKILKADLRKLASAEYAKRQLRPKL
jgi:hypothetical protein